MSNTGMYIGVDPKKWQLEVASYPSRKSKSYSKDEDGINDVIGELSGNTPHLVAIRANRHLSLILIALMHRAGIPFILVRSKQIRSLTDVMGKTRRNNGLDGLTIARFASVTEMIPDTVPEEISKQINDLLLWRDRLRENIENEKDLLVISTKPVRKKIEAHLKYLEEGREAVEKDLERAVRSHTSWRESLRSLPKVSISRNTILQIGWDLFLAFLGKLRSI